MPKPSVRSFSLGLWMLGAAVTALAIAVWWSARGSGQLSGYDFFPLLGLLAFSLMWTHYIGGAFRQYWALPRDETQKYFTYTSWLVLALLLLHPGIFVVELYRDGFGFPPESYLSLYRDSAARIALLLGTLSLGIFLAYELHRKYSRAAWWKYIDYLNMCAMVAIFYHGLTLGGELNEAWFRALWFAYGLTYLLAIGYSYIHRTQGGNAHEE